MTPIGPSPLSDAHRAQPAPVGPRNAGPTGPALPGFSAHATAATLLLECRSHDTTGESPGRAREIGERREKRRGGGAQCRRGGPGLEKAADATSSEKPLLFSRKPPLLFKKPPLSIEKPLLSMPPRLEQPRRPLPRSRRQCCRSERAARASSPAVTLREPNAKAPQILLGGGWLHGHRRPKYAVDGRPATGVPRGARAQRGPPHPALGRSAGDTVYILPNTLPSASIPDGRARHFVPRSCQRGDTVALFASALRGDRKPSSTNND